MFIFDAGCGFHRAIYKKNSIRKILHIIFTGGDRIFSERFDCIDDWKDLQSSSTIVKKLFTKVGYVRPVYSTQI